LLLLHNDFYLDSGENLKEEGRGVDLFQGNHNILKYHILEDFLFWMTSFVSQWEIIRMMKNQLATRKIKSFFNYCD